MNKSRLFLHVGLPRTATTTLQKIVFPEMKKIRFLGKNFANNRLRSLENSAVISTKKIIKNFNEENKKVSEAQLILILDTLFYLFTTEEVLGNRKKLVHEIALCMENILSFWKDDIFIYSNEAMIESLAGRSCVHPNKTFVPIEMICGEDFFKNSTLTLVLRRPLDFLAASYYKRHEFSFTIKDPPLSFDTFIRAQLEVFLRKPSASRILACMQKPFINYIKTYAPNLIVNHYEDLINKKNVLDSLFGFKTGEQASCLNELPRENHSNRKEDVIKHILNAKGVPKGISMEEYTKSFEITLEHYGLNRLFKETAFN